MIIMVIVKNRFQMARAISSFHDHAKHAKFPNEDVISPVRTEFHFISLGTAISLKAQIQF
jgi:hypothetical protein